MPANVTAPVHGVFGTATQTERQVREVNQNMARVFPNRAPFWALMSKTVKVVGSKANKCEFMDIGEYPRSVTVTAEAAADATTLTVNATSHITESQVLRNHSTGEQILVTAVPSSTTLTVVRGVGTTASIIAADAVLALTGVAREEGATALSPIGIRPRLDYNLFQQFEQVHGITDRAANILYYGPSQDNLDEQEALAEYKNKIERQMLFGYRAEIPAGSPGATTHRRFLMGGAYDYIDTLGANVFDAGGAFTYQELSTYMREICRYGGNKERVGFTSLNVIGIMSYWQLSFNQMDVTKTKEFGLEFTRFSGPGWTLNLIQSEQFETEGATDEMLILDPKHVRHLIMSGMNDQVNRNITGPAKDGDHTSRHQITGVHSLELLVPQAHARVKNITS